MTHNFPYLGKNVVRFKRLQVPYLNIGKPDSLKNYRDDNEL